MGYSGAEILNSRICYKFCSFAPEGRETALYPNGCLAFISPASKDLCLDLNNSVMSASFQT
jgi:hypothetical protein